MPDLKIGLSTVGISHESFDGKVRRTLECTQNILDNLVDPLRRVGTLKTYVTTYEHEKIDEVLDFYEPTKSLVMPILGSNQIDTYLKSLILLRGEDLDLVVSTRFDILFKRSVTSMGFDYHRFNVLFEESGWKSYEFTDDNIFVFPFSMLNVVISSLERWKMFKPYPNSSVYGLHGLHHQVKLMAGEHSVNVVSLDEQKVHSNHFYRLPHIQ